MYVPPIVRVPLLQALPIPVPKLPSSFETARLLNVHMLCPQGIPQDSLIMVHTLPLMPGGPTSKCQPACPWGTMARLNEWTRIWRLPCSAKHLIILPPGLLTSCEYAHNSLVSSSTSMSPIMATTGFQPPFSSSVGWGSRSLYPTFLEASPAWRETWLIVSDSSTASTTGRLTSYTSSKLSASPGRLASLLGSPSSGISSCVSKRIHCF